MTTTITSYRRRIKNYKLEIGGRSLMRKHNKHDAAHVIFVTYGWCGARVRYWNRTVFVNIVWIRPKRGSWTNRTERNRRRSLRGKSRNKNTGDALAENFLNGGHIRLVRNIKRSKLSRWTAMARRRYTCASRFRRFARQDGLSAQTLFTADGSGAGIRTRQKIDSQTIRDNDKIACC